MGARPDLPRWIKSARLDSAAMLSAFLRYKGLCSEAEAGAVAELYSVEHAIRETITLGTQQVKPQQVPSPVPSVACTVPGCIRCSKLQGGYQFRWYSQLWGSVYTEHRRPGSWAPGEPED